MRKLRRLFEIYANNVSHKTPEELKRVATYLDRVRPFVFADKLSEFGEAGDILDLPFPVCAFELSGEFENPICSLKYAGRPLVVHVVIVEEIAPADYRFAWVASDTEGKATIGASDNRAAQDEDLFRCCYAYFSSLKNRHLAIEHVREKIKFSANGKKSQRVIRQVVHVTQKRITTPTGPYGGQIDHSHRWEVMGHWRSIAGMGKDRYGAYGVRGSTWVLPHVKGPESKPFIKKQRVVHATESVPHGFS